MMDGKPSSYTSLRCAAAGVFAGLALLFLRSLLQGAATPSNLFLFAGFVGLAAGLWFDQRIITAIGAFACAAGGLLIVIGGRLFGTLWLRAVLVAAGFALLGVAALNHRPVKPFAWISAGVLFLWWMVRVGFGGMRPISTFYLILPAIGALAAGLSFSRKNDNGGRPQRYRTAAAGLLLVYGVTWFSDLLVRLTGGGLGLSGMLSLDILTLMRYFLLPAGAILASVGLFLNKRVPAIVGLALLALPTLLGILIVYLPHASGSSGMRRRLLSELLYCAAFVFPLLAAITGKKNWLFGILTAGIGFVWILVYLAQSGALRSGGASLRMSLITVPTDILLFAGLAIACVGLIREQRSVGPEEAAGPGGAPSDGI